MSVIHTWSGQKFSSLAEQCVLVSGRRWLERRHAVRWKGDRVANLHG